MGLRLKASVSRRAGIGLRGAVRSGAAIAASCGAVVACGGLAEDIFTTRDVPGNEAGGADASGSTPEGSDVDGARGDKCLPQGGTVELLRFPADMLSNLVARGQHLFVFREGMKANEPSLVRLDLETRAGPSAAVPLARAPRTRSFGVDDTSVYFVDEVADAGLVPVRYLHDGSGPVEISPSITTLAANTTFAPSLETGAAFLGEWSWHHWMPGSRSNEVLAQGGTGPSVAVAAGPGGAPYCVLQHPSTPPSPDADRVDLVILGTLGGPVHTLPGTFSALGRAPGAIIAATWMRAVEGTTGTANATIARFVDGQATISSAILVDGEASGATLGRVDAIAATNDMMVWAQGESSPEAGCASGYATYAIRTHALPGASAASDPVLVAGSVTGPGQCAPPSVAIDECNVYWVDGDRVMARAR